MHCCTLFLYLDSVNPTLKPMRLRFAIIVFLLFYVSASSGQQTLYIFSEIHPGWKTRALDHWSTVKGYGKTVPAEMSERIKENYDNAEKRLELCLKQETLAADLEKDPVFVSNPGSIVPADGDVFMDLRCNLVEITEKYPNFRNRKLNILPVVRYELTLYGPAGTIIFQNEYLDSIDYRKSVRPYLLGMSEHRRDVEIVRQSFLHSLSDGIPGKIIADVGDFFKSDKYDRIQADTETFREVLSLIFEDRKLNYPSDYESVKFLSQTQPVPQGFYSETDPSATPATKNSDELGLLLEGSTFYALIIGVNTYADPAINDLTEPLKDAGRLISTLKQNYTFDEENIRLLANPTRDELIRSLDALAYELTDKDNLLIFYAGHGLWDDQLKKGFWIPADANTDNRANWFSNSDLRDYIGGIRAKHTLLISDACFSGGIFKTREAFSAISPATVELYKLPSRKAMTSGAMTTVPDESVFIEYLLRRLEENSSPVLSAEQLFASFKIAVINNSPTKQVPQFGEIRETGDEGGDFLFIRKMNK